MSSLLLLATGEQKGKCGFILNSGLCTLISGPWAGSGFRPVGEAAACPGPAQRPALGFRSSRLPPRSAGCAASLVPGHSSSLQPAGLGRAAGGAAPWARTSARLLLFPEPPRASLSRAACSSGRFWPGSAGAPPLWSSVSVPSALWVQVPPEPQLYLWRPCEAPALCQEHSVPSRVCSLASSSSRIECC